MLHNVGMARAASIATALVVFVQVAQAQSGTLNAGSNGTSGTAVISGTGASTVFSVSTLYAQSPQTGIFAPIAFGTAGSMQSTTLGSGANNVPNFVTISGFTFSQTNVSAGVFSSAVCAAAAAAGQTCSPSGTGLDLRNTQNGMTLSFQTSGTLTGPGIVTTDDYTGVFTTQFTTTYQQFLATLASGGTVTTSWSATFTAAPATTAPEPNTFALLGTGLLGLAGGIRVRRRGA